MSIENPRVAIIGLGFGAEFDSHLPTPSKFSRSEATLSRGMRRALIKLLMSMGLPKDLPITKNCSKIPEIDAGSHKYTHSAPCRGNPPGYAGREACGMYRAYGFTSVEDCEAIVQLSSESGMKYMMMETKSGLCT